MYTYIKQRTSRMSDVSQQQPTGLPDKK